MSAGATAMPMKTLAANELPKLLASPAHMQQSTSSKIFSNMMGLRPKILARGTHQRLAAPIISTFTLLGISIFHSFDSPLKHAQLSDGSDCPLIQENQRPAEWHKGGKR